jgi:hypothetical protein
MEQSQAKDEFTCRRSPVISILREVLVTQEERVRLIGSWPALRTGCTFFTPLTAQKALEAAVAIINDEDGESRVQPKTNDDTKPHQ